MVSLNRAADYTGLLSKLPLGDHNGGRFQCDRFRSDFVGNSGGDLNCENGNQNLKRRRSSIWRGSKVLIPHVPKLSFCIIPGRIP
jgi:hypothetical protein